MPLIDGSLVKNAQVGRIDVVAHVTRPCVKIVQMPMEKDPVKVPVYQPRSADVMSAWIFSRALNSCVMSSL